MSRSFLSTFANAIATIFKTLMNVQSRAEAHRAAAIDLRYLPESLQRDVGLVDGRMLHMPTSQSQSFKDASSKRWSDNVHMPHAS